MGSSAPPPPFGAVILAGGRGSRMGGADKPALAVGNSTMVASVAGAAAMAGARQLVVVGPARGELAQVAAGLAGGLAFVREKPPGGGPVPALRAGLPRIDAPLVALLAADLPFLRSLHLRMLLAAVAGASGRTADKTGDCPGAVLVDDEGRQQWLAGVWRTAPLAAALSRYGGGSLHGLLAPLAPALIGCEMPPGVAPPWLDCDTPADLELARSHLELGNRKGREQ
jgi:molybdopterin-guanine dinucleotide biosynthesis protein A